MRIGAWCCSTLWVACALYVANMWWAGRLYVLDMATHFAVLCAYFFTAVALAHSLLRRRPRVWILWCVALGSHWSSILHFSTRTVPIGECTSAVSAASSASQATLTILSFNINAQRIEQEAFFLRLMEEHDPDVVCIIETPLGMANRIDPGATRYPHRVRPDPGRWWSIEIMSRYPFELPELWLENDENIHSFVRTRSPLLRLSETTSVLLSVFHPASPRSEKLWLGSQSKLARDASMMRAWNQGRCLPIVAIGDFNSTPFGRMHQEFARASGLRSHTNIFTGGTWPAQLPRWFSLPIDTVWTNNRVEVESLIVGEGDPSDHRAIVTRLRIH